MAVLCGLSFKTHYLAMFPVLYLLLWYAFWIPKGKRLLSLPAIIITLSISLVGVGTFAAQLGARPQQFHKEIGFWQELMKIVNDL